MASYRSVPPVGPTKPPKSNPPSQSRAGPPGASAVLGHPVTLCLCLVTLSERNRMVRAYEELYADYMSMLRRRREAHQLGLLARLTADEHALIDEMSEA